MPAAGRNSNNTLQYPLASGSSIADNDTSYTNAFRAIRLAIRSESNKLQPLDWEILQGLYGAKNPLCFNGVFLLINPYQPTLLSVAPYYDSLARMLKRGVILETKRPNGWRQWAISTKGRRAVIELNKLARTMAP